MPAGRLLTYKGETLQIGQWAKRFNHHPMTIATRLYRFSWPLEKALLTPPVPQCKTINYTDGIEMYHFIMRRFFTKQRRLESYKRLIVEMKEARMKKAA